MKSFSDKWKAPITKQEIVQYSEERIVEMGLKELSQKHTRAMFRQYLNVEYGGRVDQGADYQHKNNEFVQRKRAYGDYLYNQDRSMFETIYREWLEKISRGEVK